MVSSEQLGWSRVMSSSLLQVSLRGVVCTGVGVVCSPPAGQQRRARWTVAEGQSLSVSVGSYSHCSRVAGENNRALTG